ncbi:MAG: amylo-alpha-1,6-glucosidase [Chloroflexia bacterium]
MGVSTGRLLVAGVPWYAVPFRRDSLITSLQTLCFRPGLPWAPCVSRTVAGEGRSAARRGPGKILHELRFSGSLASAPCRTRPLRRVDSTLFMMLFAQTLRWTGDRGLYAELLPAVRRALEWCDNYGDLDGDGYIEYNRRSDGGIGNQGWKDSGDSLLRPNGENVTPPIALVEPQAYVHAAKAWLADVAAQMGDDAFAADLRAQAAELAERFNRDYWLPERGYYAQALDAEKRPIGDVTSNGGHALMCGIVPPDRAALISNRLLEQDMLSGWGVRTRSSLDPHYNPISYHNGSVWPHDNSLLAFGMGKVGERTAANVVAEQTLAVSREFRLARLPELLCGYSPSQTGGRPAEYPVSCSPQAWAAGSAFLLLQSILGLAPDALAGVLRLDPCLPEWLGAVEIENLQVGEAKLSLRVGADGVEVIASDGVEVVVAS